MSLKNYKEIETNKVELDIVISKEAFENAVNEQALHGSDDNVIE